MEKPGKEQVGLFKKRVKCLPKGVLAFHARQPTHGRFPSDARERNVESSQTRRVGSTGETAARTQWGQARRDSRLSFYLIGPKPSVRRRRFAGSEGGGGGAWGWSLRSALICTVCSQNRFRSSDGIETSNELTPFSSEALNNCSTRHNARSPNRNPASLSC